MKSTVLARAAAVAAAALALAACSTINPITTANKYQASDGVHVELGENAEALNLLVMTSAKDAPAVLTGSVHNAGSEDIDLRITFDGANTADVEVPAGATVRLGTGEGQTLVQGTSPVAPGGLAPVVLATPTEGAITVNTPVVDGTIPPYQDIVDTIPALPAASPSASPSPTE